MVRDHVGSVEKSLDHDHDYFIQVGSDGKVIRGWTSPAQMVTFTRSARRRSPICRQITRTAFSCEALR